MLFWGLLAAVYVDRFEPPAGSFRRRIAEWIMDYNLWTFKVAFSALNLGLGGH